MSRMRGKPDLSGITPPRKDPTAFLEGATEDCITPTRSSTANHISAHVAEFPPMPTVQKLFRIRWDIAKGLKNGAIAESSPGCRVTETEIVERLLKQYLNIDS